MLTAQVKNRTHRPAPVAERYGMLKVLMFMPKKGWLCKCDCGKEKFVDGNHLRNFKYLSCGYNSRERKAVSLSHTLQKKREALKARPKRVRHATHGTRCWVCRNKTGTTEVVALCGICKRGCI